MASNELKHTHIDKPAKQHYKVNNGRLLVIHANTLLWVDGLFLSGCGWDHVLEEGPFPVFQSANAVPDPLHGCSHKRYRE